MRGRLPLALAALILSLSAGPGAAQQVTGPAVEDQAAVQPGTAGQAAQQPPAGQPAVPESSGTVEQPRFVRAPQPGEFVVTPLAPPAGAATPQPGQGAARLGGAGQLPQVISPQQAPSDTDADRWHRAPETQASTAPRLAPNLPLGPAVPIEPPPTDLRDGARLRELDKMTGQTVTFQLAVGQSRQVGRLKIRLDACRSPEGNDMHGTTAFLKVWDMKKPDDEAFSGWMFAESPSISALDHPRYDLWVISCTTSSVAASGPSE